MAEIVTYTEAVDQLRGWVKAREAIASGASYSIGGRTLTRQDSETIEANIQRWHNTVVRMEAEQAGKTRALGARPSFRQPGSGGAGGIISVDMWADWRT